MVFAFFVPSENCHVDANVVCRLCRWELFAYYLGGQGREGKTLFIMCSKFVAFPRLPHPQRKALDPPSCRRSPA